MSKIQTILGTIDPDRLSVTLPHEHLIIDSRCLWSPPKDNFLKSYARQHVKMSNLGVLRRSPNIARDNLLLDDVRLAVKEVTEFKNAGGRSLVDATSIGLGRDIGALHAVANKTGLNIIAGCGYYIAKSHPPQIRNQSVEEIGDQIIGDITKGIEGSHARSGVIGEIGVSVEMDPAEKRVLKAAAAAHLETGCPIMVHLSPPGRQGKQVLNLLEKEGVPLTSVALSHLDSQLDVEYDISLARRGCFISYDQFSEQYEDYDGLTFPTRHRASGLRNSLAQQGTA